ncbi:MAG: response regulator, partial [Vicinamibacteria bacterium]
MTKAKILLVDDVQAMIEFERSIIEKLGLDVITAGDGASAIKQITIEKPTLVILDLML